MNQTNQTSWAQRMAHSIMERTPRLYEAKGYNEKWSYDYGVILKGFERLWRITGDQQYFDYIKSNMDHFIQEDGSIRGYRQDEHNIDHLNNGKLLYVLYKETGEDKYKLAASTLRKQLLTHPRTSEGAFWHKEIYPYQIWLDGLYMGSPFYLEYLLTFESEGDLGDVTKQFILCEKHTRDDRTGLLFHAWDEKRVQPWCDKSTGLSPNFWGRSLGWFLMAITDVLELLPKEHADYNELERIFKDTLTAVADFQDAESGVWYQVVNEAGRKGNYLEASASSMFTYAMAKGIRLGLLGSEWNNPLQRAFQGLIAEFILETKEGWLNLNKTCQVAGLGGADRRDGTYAYYISEPIITNDQKGLGAFLLACAEYEELIQTGELSLPVTEGAQQ
ncbi:glycoside hydrolase family 88 protein [Paenibacillus urinalis]|uniref:Glycoside hydrolase family 88 protein n=1 Tax=Paenibacillus urinalis TaxID=521520 RepID=A0AAX3MT48_9BACL|nr:MULTISPECIES: glycoside hydrolase family 88 protein [Paenibacillus]WDH80796.1 glycoside hydrolase family 88 protein [Paenibacillus urinalis]WDH96848.1 glycoside hydrolase family 88 protein [Paenibacillus urinalis]WDI00491.1 glycoside hydrolase family 88 protein [Paenibacillus urinalis]GAK39164.1 glycosyl hydrolase [Paenibacillus sp. TCA20]